MANERKTDFFIGKLLDAAGIAYTPNGSDIKQIQTYHEVEVLRIEDFAKTATDRATLTHWLHNVGTKFARPIEKRVRELLPRDIRHVFEGSAGRANDDARQLSFEGIFNVPFPSPETPKFTFIDLFAGIGGFRLAMQNLGGKCVFTSEWDTAAQKTYFANFGEVPYGDITLPETKAAIPEGFDILCAGFPCQAFSIAGRKMGFKDNFKGMSRGTLFRDVVDICENNKPKVVFCENVKGLTIHNGGKTLAIIKGAFAELGYKVFSQVLNSKNYGVPQHRERIYIVAFRNDVAPNSFDFPPPLGETSRIRDILENKPVSPRYYLSETYMETLRRHKARHEAKGNGFGYEVRDWNATAGAIVCGGMGRERNLIVDKRQTCLVPVTHIKGEINKEGIRKMTPREWARLQGFPDTFSFVLADVHLYKQFGNSVSVPVVETISKKIIEAMSYE